MHDEGFHLIIPLQIVSKDNLDIQPMTASISKTLLKVWYPKPTVTKSKRIELNNIHPQSRQ